MLSSKPQIFLTLGEPDSLDAAISVDKFISWRDSKNDNYFIQIEYRGSLKRKDIALNIQEEQETKFGKSALTQNKWITFLLEELEDHLREKGVLPDLTTEAREDAKKGTKDNPKQYDKSQHKAAQDAKRLAQLQQANLQQQARIMELERLLDSNTTKSNIYAELAELGADFGD